MCDGYVISASSRDSLFSFSFLFFPVVLPVLLVAAPQQFTNFWADWNQLVTPTKVHRTQWAIFLFTFLIKKEERNTLRNLFLQKTTKWRVQQNNVGLGCEPGAFGVFVVVVEDLHLQAGDPLGCAPSGVGPPRPNMNWSHGQDLGSTFGLHAESICFSIFWVGVGLCNKTKFFALEKDLGDTLCNGSRLRHGSTQHQRQLMGSFKRRNSASQRSVESPD